jgi:hypothetical protein
LSVSDIERKVVPRTGNDVALEPAFDKRPPFVRTAIVNGIKLPIDVEQGDRSIIDFDDLRLSRWYIFNLTDLLKPIYHMYPLGVPHGLCEMLKKSTTGGLVSLKGSTCRSRRLTSLLSAALLENLSEHPDVIVVSGAWNISATACS